MAVSTRNWNTECRATVISIGDEVIEIRDEHVHENFSRKPEARKVNADTKSKSELLTPSVAVSTTVLPVTNDYGTQLSSLWFLSFIG